MADLLRWLKSPTQVGEDLRGFVRTTVIDRIDGNSERFAQEMTAWMQANAPWEDRTGEARANLHVTVERTPTHFIFTAQHGVDYGIFLETMQAGRFAILDRAVAEFAPRVRAIVKAEY